MITECPVSRLSTTKCLNQVFGWVLPWYKGCWKKNLTVWYLDILGANLTYIETILNLDHKRNVRDLGLNWQIAKYYKDPMKVCIMRYKIKSRWVNMNNKSTSTLWLVNLCNISSTKPNHYCQYPIHSINPKL